MGPSPGGSDMMGPSMMDNNGGIGYGRYSYTAIRLPIKPW